jgi:hypothetical protein
MRVLHVCCSYQLVTRSRYVYSVGTEINLQMGRMNLLVAQRDHGIDFARTAGRHEAGGKRDYRQHERAPASVDGS